MDPIAPIDPSLTIERFRRGPLGAARIEGQQLRAIVDATPLYAFTGDGRMSSREIVPLTTAAREVPAGKHGDAYRKVLQGSLSVLDGFEGRNNLSVIALPTNDLQRAVASEMSSQAIFGYVTTPAKTTKQVAAIKEFWSFGKGGGSQNLGWLVHGPMVGRDIGRLVRGEASGFEFDELVREIKGNKGWKSPGTEAEIAGTILGFAMQHELNHSRTAPKFSDLTDGAKHLPLNMWEEGGAELLSHWPGAAQETARRMGLPTSDATVLPPQTGYLPLMNQLKRVVLMAGIDPTKAADLPRAIDLLQGDDLPAVPLRVATAIAQHNRIDPTVTSGIAKALLQSELEPALIDKVEKAVKELAGGAPKA